MAATQEGSEQLQKGLRQRHMTMISLGGVIGAGLFVGSGAVMNQTGPAATTIKAMIAPILMDANQNSNSP